MRRDRQHKLAVAYSSPAIAENPKVPGFTFHCRGAHGEIWLSDEVNDAFQVLCKATDERSVKEANKLKRHFQRFADAGPTSLQAEAFKSQKKQSYGGTTVHVFAFKAFQYRIYGLQTDRKGTRCFVGFSYDSDKKRDEADKECLKRVVKLSSTWVEGV